MKDLNTLKTREVRGKLPGFASDKSKLIGLGNIVLKVTSKFGVKACSGCVHRAEFLNKLLSVRYK